MFDEASPRTGKLVLQKAGDEDFYAFVPHAIPPTPPIKYDEELNRQVDEARVAKGPGDLGVLFNSGETWTVSEDVTEARQDSNGEAIDDTVIEEASGNRVPFDEVERELESLAAPD